MKVNFLINFHQIIDELTMSVNFPKLLLPACFRVIRISFVWKSKQETIVTCWRLEIREVVNNPFVGKGVTDVPFGPVSAFSPRKPYKHLVRFRISVK